MLTSRQKEKIRDFVNKQEIDVTELSSYVNRGHPPQDYARFPDPDDEEWDEYEEWEEMGDQAIEKIKSDGLWEYTHIKDELKDEAIEYIKKLTQR